MNNMLTAAYIESIVSFATEEMSQIIEDEITNKLIEDFKPRAREFARTQAKQYLIQSIESWRQHQIGKDNFIITVEMVDKHE